MVKYNIGENIREKTYSAIARREAIGSVSYERCTYTRDDNRNPTVRSELAKKGKYYYERNARDVSTKRSKGRGPYIHFNRSLVETQAFLFAEAREFLRLPGSESHPTYSQAITSGRRKDQAAKMLYPVSAGFEVRAFMMVRIVEMMTKT